jgi:hypothetical protein
MAVPELAFLGTSTEAAYKSRSYDLVWKARLTCFFPAGLLRVFTASIWGLSEE